jgi:hypothetical protein
VSMEPVGPAGSGCMGDWYQSLFSIRLA